MTDFTKIDYLKNGNPKQQKAFELLTQKNILSQLEAFDPILVGTIPINIDIENSDLDVICYWKNKDEFTLKVTSCFKYENQFSIRETLIDNQQTIIATFETPNFQIEIFGQNLPTTQQNGYRHMLVEHQILQRNGEEFRLQIIQHKQNGYKTEPAFAKLLGLKGNPYVELLNYRP